MPHRLCRKLSEEPIKSPPCHQAGSLVSCGILTMIFLSDIRLMLCRNLSQTVSILTTINHYTGAKFLDKIDSVLAQKLYHDILLYFWTKLIGCFPPATPVSVLPGYPVTWTHNLFGHKTPATENNGQRKQSHYLQSNDTTYKKPISGQFLASKMLVKLHKKYTIHYYFLVPITSFENFEAYKGTQHT